jgi:YggT family protein
MDILFVPLLRLLANIIDLYVWIVVIGVVLSWLAAFNVVNTSNRFIYIAADFIHRITEPALKPIRNFLGNFLPNLGGFDVSPVVLILVLIAAQEVLFRLIVKLG